MNETKTITERQLTGLCRLNNWHYTHFSDEMIVTTGVLQNFIFTFTGTAVKLRNLHTHPTLNFEFPANNAFSLLHKMIEHNIISIEQMLNIKFHQAE